MVDGVNLISHGAQVAAENANANGARNLAVGATVNIAIGQDRAEEAGGQASSTNPSVIVDLSEEAQDFLAAHRSEEGDTTATPAELAREFLAAQEAGQGGAFGQVVSTFAQLGRDDVDLSNDEDEENVEFRTEEYDNAAILRSDDDYDDADVTEEVGEGEGIGPLETPAANEAPPSDLFGELEQLRSTGGARAIA